jgi:hypothetical protein
LCISYIRCIFEYRKELTTITKLKIMTTSRFTKGQKIFQVEIHNNKAIKIHEKVVLVCGLKKLKLKGEWLNSDYRLCKGFSNIGRLGNMIEQFYSTEEEAAKEMNLYNSKN